MYIYQHKEWPHFTWDEAKLSNLLVETRHLQGKLLGNMGALGFKLQSEATLLSLTQDVLKSCEIEGEILNKEQVRSSIARRLGIDIGVSPHIDRNVEGIVEVMLDATRNYNRPLTKERLFDWHAALFPTGRSGMHRINVGQWRNKASGAMQVVSGPIGREKVHYEAPSYDKVDKEMIRFIKWFNLDPDIDLVIKAAIAHLWFISIHPFDDGNGRIGRAIIDMVLAQSENSMQRFYSMSSEIERRRKYYYNILEKCQKGSIDITLWIEWFLNCFKSAMESSTEILEAVLIKARFWELHREESFNKRQCAMINRLLDKFEGKLTSSKWAKITKCSQDTALRDINDLLKLKILKKNEASGRSTSYILLKN